MIHHNILAHFFLLTSYDSTYFPSFIEIETCQFVPC